MKNETHPYLEEWQARFAKANGRLPHQHETELFCKYQQDWTPQKCARIQADFDALITRSIDCSATPKDELTVKAVVALGKEQLEAERRGEKWFHPHILKYGKGLKADARRKEAEEYYKTQTTLLPEAARALRFLKWRARYVDELNREPSAETAQHAWEKNLL